MALLNSTHGKTPQSPLEPDRRRRTRRSPFIRLLILFAAWCLSAQAAPQYSVDQVKAACLFNFAQFVEWPVECFEDASSPFVIGILGDSPLTTELGNLVKNEKINGHPCMVVRYTEAAKAVKSHILYIPGAGPTGWTRLFAQLKGGSILTVGESEELLRGGGVIRFLAGRKIKLRINVTAAKTARLNISSKLLRLAEVVHYE